VGARGRGVVTAAPLDVCNPATGELLATLPVAGPEELDAAVEAARRAMGDWGPDERRASALVAIGKALLGSADELARTLTAEQGKPLAEALDEVRGAAAWFLHYGRLEVADERLQDDEHAEVTVRRRPVGVVGAITPWNFPLMLAAFKLAPALRAGCAVVLKPSPFTPLATLEMVERMNEVLPKGLVQVLVGGNELGAAITRHPGIRKISFTGSTATGKAIAAAAADDLKRLTLELGGNDAAIVLDDADVGAIAPRLYRSAFLNAGQVCCAVKRVYAPRARYDEVVDALAALAVDAVVGDGLDPATTMGPVNNRPQLEKVAALVEEARSGGALPAAGGRALDGPGLFYAPTILRDVPADSPIVQEEQFGPALPVVAYDDVEQALAWANGTPYGLSGSVWGADEERAAELAARLECGTAWVNTHLALSPAAPFSGWKWSGLGVENGLRGLEAFTELQVLHRTRRAARP